ncbi:phage tail family protein [Leucobacter massiliensis]|uniref:Phage tail protein n=1 Tax=Leucobacter massiliensis TaxID=1686285 RepID=A0A2S9QMV9_9MICO|nr:phage tail family protein [Leucobacter massiliensis]PRI10915.1 hypothetical protein B4915_08500 [Leucobacter massiliensis]
MDEEIIWVDLLGVTLAGAKEPDAGLIWSNLEGWWGLPDVRGTADSIPGGHGRFPRSKVLRDSRVITLTGHIYTGSNAELHAVRDRLEAALAAGAGPMRVSTVGGIWERWVEIDTLKIDPDRGRKWTRFIVDMVAPDPRRYGPQQRLGPVGLPVIEGGLRLPKRTPWNTGRTSEAARLLVPNPGAIALNPVITVSGGFDAVTVRDITDGRRLRLEWPIPDGEFVTLDSRIRRAQMGAAELTRWMTARQWFAIPAGETHEFRFDVEGRAGDPKMWADYRIGAM